MTLQDTEPSEGPPEAEAANGSKTVQVAEPEAPFTVTAPVPYSGSGSLRNPFPPIADYSFLSDCENTCLISSAGSVEWLCVPRPDSPSVFGAILDRGAGHFRLGPYGVSVPAARRYLPGSLILETTWQTHTGWVIVRDALVMGPWHDIDARSRTHRRTPMDWDAEHILLRTVRSRMCSASQSIGVRRCVRDRVSMSCHGPITSASRTITQPVWVCQVVSRIRLPGR